MQVTTFVNRMVGIFILWPFISALLGASWWLVWLPYICILTLILFLLFIYKIIFNLVEYSIDFIEFISDNLKKRRI